MPDSFDTPVCLILFKRPDCTKSVLEVIRTVRPRRLFVIADGARPQVAGEREQCLATQRLLDDVDWDCEVIVNRAIANQGGRQRVISGLNWLFSQVDRAIILEDDCLPELSFFPFCAELLEQYADDSRVACISGNNFQLGDTSNADSYYFSLYPSIWGWATWRRAWQHYDPSMHAWPEVRSQNGLAAFLPDARTIASWTHVFDLAYQGLTAWDYPWIFACFLHQGLTIVPRYNLVRNIGFDQNATGGFDLLPASFIHLLAEMPCHDLTFPLHHPDEIKPLAECDRLTQIFVQDLYWHTEQGEMALRQALATRWLQGSAQTWKHPYGQAYIQHVLNSNLGGNSSMASDQALLDDLKHHLAQAPDSPDQLQPDQLKYLLVAMLHLHPHQLPRFFNPADVPDWVRDNYLTYMLTSPEIFTEMGEADAYAHYLQRWVSYLHDQITQHPESSLWQKVAAHFAQKFDFMMLYFNDQNLKTFYQQRSAILEFALQHQGCELNYTFPPRARDRTKIRLGILAFHFGPHTETYTTLPAFKHLNRDRFEIQLFTVNVGGHRLERYCSGHADSFVQLPPSLPEQVQMIRAADLDILWIGSNVTHWASPVTQLACHRLGRIQVASTSACTTTGIRHINYYLSGDLTEHPEAQSQYTETLVNLSGPAHVHDFGSEEQLLPTLQFQRSQLKIPDDAVVYVSGANLFKITPELEDAWIKILARVPNAYLMLYPFNQNWSDTYPIQAFQQRLQATLERHQVNPARVLLLPPVPNRADVQERLKLADIYLDSFPFAGVNSLLDPLELGIPCVVKDGLQFRSRMGVAFLRDLDIPELIANSDPAYIECAIALGTQPKLRSQMRDRILAKMPTCRFRDSRQYATQVSDVLEKLFYELLHAELAENLKLQQDNWIIFPDWSQDEAVIGTEIAQVISDLATQSSRDQTTLLIDVQGIDYEDANLFISSIAMSLMMESDLDLANGPEISLVDEPLTTLQWRALQSVVQVLEIEHQSKRN